MTTDASVFASRREKLNSLLPQQGLDAVALNAGPMQTYFTDLHFHLMERPVVVFLMPNQFPIIVLPEFEKGKTEGIKDLTVVTYGEDPALWQESFSRAAAELIAPPKRIGVEGLRMRVMELRYLEGALPGAKFEQAEPLIAQLRMHKDEAEIDAMQKAVEIAEAALEATVTKVKIGMTEREISGILIQNLYTRGCDPELPFLPIIAAGANSANPHATVSDRKVQKGDLLLFDWGANVGGYFSDLTRTFAVGEIDEELKRIYEIVKLANQAGRD